MANQIHNNFNNLKQDFFKDTGLNANENIELYIHYFNARMLDRIMQYEHITQFEVVNRLDHLPDIIESKIIASLKKIK